MSRHHGHCLHQRKSHRYNRERRRHLSFWFTLGNSRKVLFNLRSDTADGCSGTVIRGGFSIMTTSSAFIPYGLDPLDPEERALRADAFYTLMNQRRSVRSFSSDPVSRELIERAILTASTAPSGAHRQPWKFIAISSAEIKKEIRLAVEEEEKRNYSTRMPEEWRNALAPLGTTWGRAWGDGWRRISRGSLFHNYHPWACGHPP